MFFTQTLYFFLFGLGLFIETKGAVNETIYIIKIKHDIQKGTCHADRCLLHPLIFVYRLEFLKSIVNKTNFSV